jgi:predicted transcriptional regulator
MAYGILLPMGSSMEKTTVYLDQETRRGLKALSRATGRPQAELIREALDEYLDRTPRYALPGWVGAWKHGPSTDSGEIKRVARSEWGAALGLEDP